ncbi:phosphotransferase [Shimazuella kribbensis]|uniref:phosphotransferase n=1 Tax=Shimazuella kribbensis TaxID=139808 RepID=UPI0003FE9210|nr:phosphotransferase [Shimazuella kribbensis]
MREQPDINRLSHELHTPIYDVKSYKNYWLVMGKTGKWLAKPIRDVEHNVWWEDIEQKLRERNFHAFPESKRIDNWLLSYFIDGEMVSYKDKKVCIPLMRTLATFHIAGQKLDTPPTFQAAYLLSDRLYERLNQFYHHLSKLHRYRHDKTFYLLSRYGPVFYQHAYDAYQRLYKIGLPYFAQSARKNHMLSHRDLASHNWIMDGQKELWLIDFETAAYDLQIGDVWQVCSRMLNEHQWDVDLFQTLIQTYESVNPLTQWERQALSVLCGFPNEFLRETIGILEKKSGYKEDLILPYLEKMVYDYPLWIDRVNKIQIWLSED